MTGIIFSLLAASGFAATAIFARTALQRMSTPYGTLLSLCVSTVAAMIIAAVLHPDELVGLSAVALGWLFLVGFLNFPLGRMFNYTSVTLVGVSKASTVVATSPLFATMLAVIILGERVSAITLLGTVAVIGGLALILNQE